MNKIIKSIRIIFSAPFILLAMIFGLLARIVYGKGYDEYVISLAQDFHNRFHHHG